MSLVRVTGDDVQFRAAVDAAMREIGMVPPTWVVVGNGMFYRVPDGQPWKPWWKALVKAMQLAERGVDEVRFDTSPLSENQTVDEWAKLLFPA
jgi:hypothetical protein